MAFEKPKFLSRYHAEAFQDESVVAVYHMRPPNPEEAFEINGDLMSDKQGRLLDVGCGLGDVARHMLPYAEHIDAVDFSPGTIRGDARCPAATTHVFGSAARWKRRSWNRRTRSSSLEAASAGST